MGYRSCLGLLSLAKQYGHQRLEAACARALALRSPARRTVLESLRHGLENQPLPGEEEAPVSVLHHENVRGPQYYQTVLPIREMIDD
jgi:hypothetical protein